MQKHRYALMVDDELIEKRTFLARLNPEQQRNFCRNYATLHDISYEGVELVELRENAKASEIIYDMRKLVTNLGVSDWHKLNKTEKRLLRDTLLDLNVIERAIQDD